MLVSLMDQACGKAFDKRQVLHATPSINDTLTGIRKLIHPRGRLFIQELNPSESLLQI
jgi:hypothetical protein